MGTIKVIGRDGKVVRTHEDPGAQSSSSNPLKSSKSENHSSHSKSSNDASVFAGSYTRLTGSGEHKLTVHSKTPYKADDEIFTYEAYSQAEERAEKKHKEKSGDENAVNQLANSQKNELIQIAHKNPAFTSQILSEIEAGISNGDSFDTIKNRISTRYNLKI